MSRSRCPSKPSESRYTDPVARLLSLGDPIPEGQKMLTETPLADYPALGITGAHATDLIRMLRDRALFERAVPEGYAPLHAARALAVLGVSEAIPHVIDFTRRLDHVDADAWLELMPLTLARFGPGAIDPLARVYRDHRESFGTRIFLGDALERIAATDPSALARVVRVFTDTLAYARYNDPSINADAIDALNELFAADALPAIRAAFEGGYVDEFGCGSLEEIETEIVMTPEQRRLKREADSARLRAKLDLEEFRQAGSSLEGNMETDEDTDVDADSDSSSEDDNPEIVVPARSAAALARAAGTEHPAGGD